MKFFCVLIMSLSVSVPGLATETIRFEQDVEITLVMVESPLLSAVAQNLLNRLDVRANYTSLLVGSVSRAVFFEGRSREPYVEYLRVSGSFSRCEGPIEQLMQRPHPLRGTGSIVTEVFQTFDRSRDLRSTGEQVIGRVRERVNSNLQAAREMEAEQRRCLVEFNAADACWAKLTRNQWIGWTDVMFEIDPRHCPAIAPYTANPLRTRVRQLDSRTIELSEIAAP